MGLQQGFRGWMTLSPTASPVRVLCEVPGPQLSMPANFDTLYPASNQPFGEINRAEGITFPTLEAPMAPMTAWWTAVNLNAWFHTRTSDDLAAIGGGGIDFADSAQAAGIGRFRMQNAKGCGYRLSWAFQERVRFLARFWGTDLDPLLPASAPGTGLTGTQLMQNAVAFGGALNTGDIISGSLEYDNGCTPNPVLNGTLRPTEINAGLPTAFLTLQHNGGVPLASGSTGTITVGSVVFTVTDLECLNPRDRSQQAGRVVRSFRYKIYGSTTAFPVVVS
jgi:hypothetical protein